MDVALARAWVQAIAVTIAEHTDLLTQLDSAIGDADHGVNLNRGFTAVTAKLAGLEPRTAGEVLVATGTTLMSSVGGAAGPLYGGAFRAIGKALTEPDADVKEVLTALTEGLGAIQQLGAAVPGDKTMVDAYAPALTAFDRAVAGGGDLASAAATAAEAAEEGMRATTPLQARKGRASYLGPRSIGHQDPGATSTALIFRALAQVVTVTSGDSATRNPRKEAGPSGAPPQAGGSATRNPRKEAGPSGAPPQAGGSATRNPRKEAAE